MSVIGVDIGGTKIAAAVISPDGSLGPVRTEPTPGNDVADTERAIVGLVGELAGDGAPTAVGIGAAGWISADRATVLFSPHLAWRNERLRDSLQARIGAPIIIENDANAAAWAEYRFGAARGHATALCVTLGTGIGGGIVLDGQIFRGAFGLAGEWGHTRVVPDGRRCACGNRGCWEQYASGRALARDARELAENSPVSAEGLLREVGGDPTAFTGVDVSRAAAAGDPAAVEIVTEAGHWLGQGIADICAILDPSIVVVGGGVAQVGAALLDPARVRFGQVLTGRGFREHATIVGAKLGVHAGIIGAADLARREVG